VRYLDIIMRVAGPTWLLFSSPDGAAVVACVLLVYNMTSLCVWLRFLY